MKRNTPRRLVSALAPAFKKKSRFLWDQRKLCAKKKFRHLDEDFRGIQVFHNWDLKTIFPSKQISYLASSILELHKSFRIFFGMKVHSKILCRCLFPAQYCFILAKIPPGSVVQDVMDARYMKGSFEKPNPSAGLRKCPKGTKTLPFPRSFVSPFTEQSNISSCNSQLGKKVLF